MNIEYQLQIKAIKGERIYYKEYGELIFISDGIIGAYLKEYELKIDKLKMIQMQTDEKTVSFNPENLKIERTAAAETKNAYKTHKGFAIKLRSKESDEQCFVFEQYLKMFKGCTGLFIKDSISPVLVYKYGVPYGIIMPIHINPDLV